MFGGIADENITVRLRQEFMPLNLPIIIVSCLNWYGILQLSMPWNPSTSNKIEIDLCNPKGSKTVNHKLFVDE